MLIMFSIMFYVFLVFLGIVPGIVIDLYLADKYEYD